MFLDEVGLQGCGDFVGCLQRVVDGPIPCSVVNHRISIAPPHVFGPRNSPARRHRTSCHAAFRVCGMTYHRLMPAEVNERRLPSAEDEAGFWALIEAASAPCSAEASRVRRALATRAPDRGRRSLRNGRCAAGVLERPDGLVPCPDWRQADQP